MKFGVIIVTYNRLSLLKECIEHCIHQTVPLSTICIVDNHSTDGTAEYLDEVAGPGPVSQKQEFQIFHLPENMGGAGGFSYGLEHASPCDWVLIIDDDAMIGEHYIERIQEQIEKNRQKGKKYLAYSGTVMNHGEVEKLHRRRIRNNWFMLYEQVPEKDYHQETFTYDVSTFCGLVLKYSLIKKIGLPKTEYFIWFDDTEYSLRVRRYSRMVNVNGAVLNHKTEQTKDAPPISWKSYYGFRNAIDIGKKYAVESSVFQCYIYLNHVAHIIIDSLCLLWDWKNRDIRRYRIQVYTDVIRDSLNGVMGKNEKYLPGTPQPGNYKDKKKEK